MKEDHFHSYCTACHAGVVFTDAQEALRHSVVETLKLSAATRALGHRQVAYICKYDRARCDASAWTPDHAAGTVNGISERTA